MTYTPQLEDIRFVLSQHIGYGRMAGLKGVETVDESYAMSVLETAGKLAAEVFAPINKVGDTQGLRLANGKVTTPEGFREAYQQYVELGLNGTPFPAEHGGLNMPYTIAMAVQELLQSGNLSLALCTLLNQGAIELLEAWGTPEQKAKYLPKMMTGEWTGTMNLTESEAGSDVGAVACKAWKDGDIYRIKGSKRFISYGEHDLSENIIHLVLARLPGAPAGTKGLSLFLAPKLLADGKPNDLFASKIEHKMGQHASPACEMQFGDKGGAWAELIGGENEGIKAMFVMMNNARLGVGIQGLSQCVRATQDAADYSRIRIQGKALQNPKGPSVAIIHHPGVRRALAGMNAQTQAARAVAYAAAIAADEAKHNDDANAKARVDLLTPIVKAWLTDLANEITSEGVQVHGGVGYVLETGVAQYMQDARVLAIYEGTNEIQALDLLFRKMVGNNGEALNAYMDEVAQSLAKIKTAKGDGAASISEELGSSLDDFRKAADHLLTTAKTHLNEAAFAATWFLRIAALVAGGHEMAKQYMAAEKLTAQGGGGFQLDYLNAKMVFAQYFAETYLPQTGALLKAIQRPHRYMQQLDQLAF